MKPSSIRKSNSSGRTSPNGQARNLIYRSLWARINQAQEKGFWFECITLCESIMADRLEALWSQLHSGDTRSRTVRTAKQTARLLLGRQHLDQNLQKLCISICTWSDARNLALHEMAKLVEGDDRTFEQKLDGVKRTSVNGIALARKASNLIRPINKRLALSGRRD